MSTFRPTDLRCQELVELITDYLERRLSFEDRTRFEQHLVNCPGCVEYLRQIRQTIRAAGRLTEEQVPAEVKEELLDVFRHWRRGRTQ